MAGRRRDVLDVREMLRRLQLGESARAVAKGLGVSRNTVREYVAWFETEGLLAGDSLPSTAVLEACLARAELHNRAAAFWFSRFSTLAADLARRFGAGNDVASRRRNFLPSP